MQLEHGGKMFVLVRNDLKSESYKAVQAGHAVAEYLQNNQTDWCNGFMIYLAVKNEDELLKWAWKLGKKEILFSVFEEPDIDDEATALACVCDGEIFKKLSLL